MNNSAESTKQPHKSGWRYLWRSKDFRRKILITLGFVIIYRFLLNIPLPGVNPDIIRTTIAPGSGLHTIASLISMLSGGSLLSFSVLALGLFPFNSVSHLLPLLLPILPSLQNRVQHDPDAGRSWFIKWNYYLSILMAVLVSYNFVKFLNRDGNLFISRDSGAFSNFLSISTAIAALTAGSFFAVWIAGLISKYGIKGRGNDILIVSGIIGGLPQEMGNLLSTAKMTGSIVSYIVIFVICIVGVIYLLNGSRNIPIWHPHMSQVIKQDKAEDVKKSQPYLPLRLEIGTEGLTGSQILLSFAAFCVFLVSRVDLPWLATAASWVINIFRADGLFFGIPIFFSVVAYTYFSSDVVLEQQNYGENLKRSGMQIPGIHSGAATQQYLRRINRRIISVAALMLGILAIAPWIFNMVFGTSLSVLEGEKLIIIVGVIHELHLHIRQELSLTK